MPTQRSFLKRLGRFIKAIMGEGVVRRRAPQMADYKVTDALKESME
jgi:hypothetical protein